MKNDGHHRDLVERAAQALIAAGRNPEVRLLAKLPDDHLQDIVDHWTSPLFVA